jgi:hypothetical protein
MTLTGGWPPPKSKMEVDETPHKAKKKKKKKEKKFRV